MKKAEKPKEWGKLERFSRIESTLSSSFFVLMFLVLLLRVSSALLAKFFIAIDPNSQIGFAQAVIQWISSNTQWTGEAAQWLWVWLVMMGIGEAERANSNLSVDFLNSKLSRKYREPLAIFLDVLYIAGMLALCLVGTKTLLRSLNTRPATLPFSNFWIYVSLPLGALFLTIRILLRLYARFRCWREGEAEPVLAGKPAKAVPAEASASTSAEGGQAEMERTQ